MDLNLSKLQEMMEARAQRAAVHGVSRVGHDLVMTTTATAPKHFGMLGKATTTLIEFSIHLCVLISISPETLS